MLNIYEAQGFWARLYGWHRFTAQAHFLYIPRCRGVHGLALKQALWVRFVTATGQPIGNWQILKPYRYLYHPSAYGVIESLALDHKKRHFIEVALQTDWLSQTKPWRLTSFGQRRCGK